MRLAITRAASAAFAATLVSLGACSRNTLATAPNAEPALTWGPAPAVFAPGAQFAVLQGNPMSAGEYTVRLRMPDGYRIAPHTHPTDEHVTVISGTFAVGMGERFRADSMAALGAGGFVTAPAGHAHYAAARGVTVVQVHGVGPFALTYVNPADLPVAARTGSR